MSFVFQLHQLIVTNLLMLVGLDLLLQLFHQVLDVHQDFQLDYPNYVNLRHLFSQQV